MGDRRLCAIPSPFHDSNFCLWLTTKIRCVGESRLMTPDVLKQCHIVTTVCLSATGADHWAISTAGSIERSVSASLKLLFLGKNYSSISRWTMQVRLSTFPPFLCTVVDQLILVCGIFDYFIPTEYYFRRLSLHFHGPFKAARKNNSNTSARHCDGQRRIKICG